MGALSVWLGAKLVTQVLAVSVILVGLVSLFCVIFKTGRRDPSAPKRPRVIAFAIPAGLATWLIVMLHVVKSQAAG
jgi:hypothetical protein